MNGAHVSHLLRKLNSHVIMVIGLRAVATLEMAVMAYFEIAELAHSQEHAGLAVSVIFTRT